MWITLGITLEQARVQQHVLGKCRSYTGFTQRFVGRLYTKLLFR